MPDSSPPQQPDRSGCTIDGERTDKMVLLFWGLAILGALVGGLSLLMTWATAGSAPQQAAGAAMAAAVAIIPYCLAVGEIAGGK